MQELIAKLSAFPNPDEEILVWVRAHTRAHSVAHVSPFEVDHSGIWISLPSHMHVVERKKVSTQTTIRRAYRAIMHAMIYVGPDEPITIGYLEVARREVYKAKANFTPRAAYSHFCAKCPKYRDAPR